MTDKARVARILDELRPELIATGATESRADEILQPIRDWLLNEREGEEEPDFEKAARLLSADPEEAGKSLSPEEREKYRQAQESVIQARRSAQQNEGNIVIGAADPGQGKGNKTSEGNAAATGRPETARRQAAQDHGTGTVPAAPSEDSSAGEGVSGSRCPNPYCKEGWVSHEFSDGKGGTVVAEACERCRHPRCPFHSGSGKGEW